MIDEQIQVNNDGTWEFQVPENLEPGTYKITLKGKDANGNTIEKPYTFTIQGNASVPTPLPNTGITSATFFIIAFVCLSLATVLLYRIKRLKTFEERVIR